MIDLDTARQRLLEPLALLPSERIRLNQALGRVATDKVCSEIHLPRFDNSAMDGYAVRAEDTTKASAESPVTLQLIGEAPAGQVFAGELIPGTTVRLFTGSQLPKGANAVVMQEDVERCSPSSIRLREPTTPWESVRFQGEDVQAGASVMTPGTRLSIGHIALLAACGIESVMVSRQPRVALLTTGTELRPPGAHLEPGEIYESNSVALGSLVQRAGGIPLPQPHIVDDRRAISEALRAAFDQADVVLTAGGASVGDHDLVRNALTDIGGSVEFWRIAMKPGKPFFYGRWMGKTLLGVPGNPVSAVVTALLLVHPALRQLQGDADVSPPHTRGLLAEPVVNRDKRRHFVRVQIDSAGQVRLAGIQASHVLSSLALASGVMDVPPETTLPSGTMVAVYHLA